MGPPKKNFDILYFVTKEKLKILIFAEIKNLQVLFLVKYCITLRKYLSSHFRCPRVMHGRQPLSSDDDGAGELHDSAAFAAG